MAPDLAVVALYCGVYIHAYFMSISSTKVAKSLEDRNSPTVPNFSLLNISGGWVSVLAMTGCVPIAGPGSTGVFGVAWGTCKVFVRHGVC